MTDEDLNTKAQLIALNEGGTMATHQQVYALLGITPARARILLPAGKAGGDVTATKGGKATAKSRDALGTTPKGMSPPPPSSASSSSGIPRPSSSVLVPKLPGQRGPYPTAAESATDAARECWGPNI